MHRQLNDPLRLLTRPRRTHFRPSKQIEASKWAQKKVTMQTSIYLSQFLPWCVKLFKHYFRIIIPIPHDNLRVNIMFTLAPFTAVVQPSDAVGPNRMACIK